MNATQTLPLPNPGDWCTLADAAAVLKLSRVQVWRIIRAKRLTVYLIGDDRRTQVPLVWRADLEAYAAARRTVRGA